MSWSERLVQDQRQRTDRAIHRAYTQLTSNPPALETFDGLLLCARKQAPRLFEAPVINGRHLGVDALVHLSLCPEPHIRRANAWTGTTSSWQSAVASLADHLICRYKVPVFLASAWYAADSAADVKRSWFIAHSRGASFRSFHLPVAMTRKMEHIFLASPHHLSIEHAMRRAELLALGASADFIQAIMSTRLATDLSEGEFWRTFWIFLIDNADEVGPTQIGPIIDYLQAIRHDRIAIQTFDGTTHADPLHPAFSLKGRTMQSVLRLMHNWHRSLGSGNHASAWSPSPFQPLIVDEPPRDSSEGPARWQMLELTNSAQLRAEGTAMRHCVASYAHRCLSGASSIWSLRLWQEEKMHHVITIEVDPKTRTIIQVRAKANRAASGKPLRILHEWASRERLQMTP